MLVRVAWWSVLLFTVVSLFGPMILIPTVFELTADQSVPPSSAAEATVGVGVILRAAVRRLLRSSARNVMQTTIGTFARTSVRAATRRVVRIAAKTGVLAFREADEAGESAESATSLPAEPGRSIGALAVGSAALLLSFAGILALLPVEQRQSLIPSTLSDTATFWLMSVLAAAPMAAYAGLAALTSRWAGVGLVFRTGYDSVLIQAYFTGAGSFLPLTTDSELIGEPRACARAALLNLLGLLGAAMALYSLGEAIDAPWVAFASTMFLVYAFVFAFPIMPLDGGYLFKNNKLAWAFVWVVILIAFLRLIPESFHVII